LSSSVGDLATEHETRSAALEQEKTRLAALHAAKTALQADIAQLRQQAAAARAAKEEHVGLYEKHFGLRFQRAHGWLLVGFDWLVSPCVSTLSAVTDNRLKFLFTKIDQAQPDKEFMFEMLVVDDKYSSMFLFFLL
jgi:hypothetical protein